MEESTDETRRVEAAPSPPSVGSPPRTRARREAARDEEEVTAEIGRSTTEEAASAGEMRTPPASPLSPLQENRPGSCSLLAGTKHCSGPTPWSSWRPGVRRPPGWRESC